MDYTCKNIIKIATNYSLIEDYNKEIKNYSREEEDYPVDQRI